MVLYTSLIKKWIWTHSRPSARELILVSVMMFLAIIIITPRFWEPGGESWNEWGAARMILDGWGMPTTNLPLGYVLYVIPFMFLEYNTFIVAEHVTTHLIAYVAIYSLLRGWVSIVPAMLLVLFFIPDFSTVVGSNTVFAAGLFAIYLHRFHRDKPLNDFIPVSLGWAALSSGAYIPFFIGHFMGALITRITQRGTPPVNETKMNKAIFAFKVLIIAIPLVAILFKSDRVDNNHYLISNQNFFPAPITSSISAAFFQIGIWNYQIHNWTPEKYAETSYQQANEEIFGGAQSVKEAFILAPDVVFENIKGNILALPFKFGTLVSGLTFPLLGFIIANLGLLTLVIKTSLKRGGALAFSILAGVGGNSLVLILTWVINYRYNVVFQPLFLIGALHAFSLADKIDKKATFRFFVAASIFSAVIATVSLLPQLSWLVSIIESHSRYAFIPISLSSLLYGFVLTAALGAWGVLNLKQKTLSTLYGSSPDIAKGLLIVCIGMLSYQSIGNHFDKYPQQVNAIMNGKGFLNHPAGMRKAYPILLETVDENSVVLSNQANWLKSFGSVRFNQIASYSDLPSERTEKSKIKDQLANVTHIWVSNQMMTKNPVEIGASIRLFKIHIEPLLTELVEERGWKVREIEGWGLAYEAGS
jgi:hypothetical protein